MPGISLASRGAVRRRATGPAVADSFTAPDGTNLSGRTTPTGSKPYSVASGTWTITSNRLSVDNVDGRIATVDTGLTNGSISATVNSVISGSNASYQGLIFRYTDAGNFFYLFMNGVAGAVQLYRVTGGGHNMILNTPYTVTNNVNYLLKAALNGSSIIASVNGTQVGSTITDTQGQTATIAGFRYGQGNTPATAGTWDDFAANASGT